MSKVTSKRQVTIPKAVADRYGIGPGDHIRWIPAGDEIRVVPARAGAAARLSTAERLALYDRATARRDSSWSEGAKGGPVESCHVAEKASDRATDQEHGWSRTDLYDRGRSG